MIKQWKPSGARVLRHTAVGGVRQSLSLIVGFLLLPWMLSRLGVERYGVLLTLQVLSMGGVLGYADGGLSAGLTRHLADAHARGDVEQFRARLSTGFFAFLAIGLGCAIVAFIFGELFFFRVFDIPPAERPGIRIGIWIYAAAFVLQFPLLALRAFYAGVHNVSWWQAWLSAERVGYALAVAVLLLYSTSLLAIVIVEQLVVATLALAFFIIARVRFPQLFRPSIKLASMSELRALWPISSRVFGFRLTTLVYERVPEIVIAALLGPVALSWYAITAKIPRALKGFGSAANAAAFPAASALDSLDLRRELARLALRGARLGYLLVTPLIAFLIVFADEVLRVWLGPDYTHLAGLLRAYLASQYIWFLIHYLHSNFTRPAQVGQLLRYSFVANLLFFLVVMLTIERFQLWSVMAGFLISGAVTVAAAIRIQLSAIAVRLREFFDHVVRVPVLGVGLASLAALLLARGQFHVSGFAGLVITGVLLYAVYAPLIFRFALRPPERQQVRRALLGT